MNIKWLKSSSTVKPKEVDYESSPDTIYLHRKITEKVIEEEGGGSHILYEYEEAKLTPAEYAVFAAKQSRDDNLAIMEALADLFEIIGGE